MAASHNRPAHHAGPQYSVRPPRRVGRSPPAACYRLRFEPPSTRRESEMLAASLYLLQRVPRCEERFSEKTLIQLLTSSSWLLGDDRTPTTAFLPSLKLWRSQ